MTPVAEPPRVVIEDGAVFNGSIEMDVKLPDDI